MSGNSDRESKDWKAEPFEVMVTLGESTTAGGWSSTPDRCWAPVLAALISDFQDEPVRLVNSGIGANVISTRVPTYERSGKPAASERLDKHVIEHRPDLLIISYGLNDARGGTPAEMFREEMTALIAEVRRGCDPLILLPAAYYMTDFDSFDHFNLGSHDVFATYNLVIEQVARETGCLFSDVYGSYGGRSWMVHYDGVHANDLGHRLIAHEIFQTLAQNCSGLAVRTKRLEETSDRWRDESVLMSDYGY
jgi:lysophospholipase L1-like esterase